MLFLGGWRTENVWVLGLAQDIAMIAQLISFGFRPRGCSRSSSSAASGHLGGLTGMNNYQKGCFYKLGVQFWVPYMKDPVILGPYQVPLTFGNSYV